MDDELEAIQQRHEITTYRFSIANVEQAHDDRGVLLTKVDELRAENNALRQEVQIAQGERLLALAELERTREALAEVTDG